MVPMMKGDMSSGTLARRSSWPTPTATERKLRQKHKA